MKEAHGRLILSSIADPKAASPPSSQRQVEITGGSITLDEAAGSRWDVSLQSPGYWAPPAVLTFPPADQFARKELPVWPTTTLRGRLRFPREDALPKEMTLAVESPPQPVRKSEIARGTHFDCPLASDGTWACTLPAATLDLAIRLKGYAPVYRWGVALNAAQPMDLGELRLQKGASLVAWLDSDSAKLLKDPATASLTRMIAPQSSQTAARLSVPVAQAAFDSRGSVQLTALPAGTYVLTVTAKGFAPARAFPIDVYAGRETALRKPVTIEPPITVRLVINPPKDPGGAPWVVHLQRVNDFAAGYDILPPPPQPVSKTGRVEVPGQEPGTFQATVRDHAGSVFVRRDLDLRQSQGEEIQIEVPLVAIRGKVLLGNAPFPSDLWFGQRNASVSVKVSTSDDGTFEGSVPHDGLWSVQVVGRSQKLETILSISVGLDDLVIKIPDTRASGIVVDPGGGPVDRMEVTADAAGRIVALPASADGTFEFRGLPETSVSFAARDLRTGRNSRRAEATLTAGVPVEGLTLRIEPDHDLTGRVVSRGAPVIGARVTATALLAGGFSPQARAVSNEEGGFHLKLPDAATRAWIVIGSPGRALQNYDVPLNGDPLVLELEPAGGTLILTWPAGSLPNVWRAGVPFMLPDLTSWARAQGETLQAQRLRVPALAPGPYRACALSHAKRADGATSEPRCTEGVLAPGGTLTLDIGS